MSAAEYLAAIADREGIEFFRREAEFVLRESSASKDPDRTWDQFWREVAKRVAGTLSEMETERCG